MVAGVLGPTSVQRYSCLVQSCVSVVVLSVWPCSFKSSVFSICLFDSVAVTVAVSLSRRVLYPLAGFFSFFGHSSCFLWPLLSASRCLLAVLCVSQLGTSNSSALVCCLFSSKTVAIVAVCSFYGSFAIFVRVFFFLAACGHH